MGFPDSRYEAEYRQQRNYRRWTLVRDDVDLDNLLNDMHEGPHTSQDPLITDSPNGSGRYRTVENGRSASLDAGGHMGMESESSGEEAENFGLTDPISIGTIPAGIRAGPGLLPKSLSLPLRQVTPDPFPELSNSPVMPLVTQIHLDSSRSSPASPMLRRVKSPKSCPGSSENSPSLQRRTHSNGGHGDGHHDTLSSSHDNLAGWTPSPYTKTMMLFHNDETSYRSLTIDANMNASDVSHLLVLKNHAVPDLHWVIVEHVKKFNIERSLEDHECVHQIHRSWGSKEDNRFYFRKDFRKYELFKNPAQFFPPHMVDTNQLKDTEQAGLFTQTERYKNILLQHLFNSDQIPDVHGYLQMKEGKRAWKKHFFVLRTSGLYYSTKGTSKDPRYLTLLVSPSDVNIYSAISPKKSLGAPTNYCLCLKPPYCVTEARDLTLLCAEDEQSQLCWMTALRLVKFGCQLRDNYKSALRYDEKLVNGEEGNMQSKKENRVSVRPRVAMDFTGPGGRVVDDPNEALGVAMEEAKWWRKKVSRKPTPSPHSDSPSQGPTGILSDTPLQPSAKRGLGSGLHMTQPWFFSGISREEAVSLIKKQGLIDGVFLVRESHSIPGVFVLSLAHNSKVKHCQIVPVEEDGELYYTMDGGTTKFTDLIQLAEFYQLNAGGLPTKLTHHVTRLL